MTDRPDYKSHPLWNDAMALARDAYRIAERVREGSAETSRRLRKAAVAVPAQVASALATADPKRTDHMLAARGALAELCRQAARAGGDEAKRLHLHAKDLDRSVLLEFGVAETVS